MAKTILVALWGRSQTSTHGSRDSGTRTALFKQALTQDRRQTDRLKIGKKQTIRTILVTPEYYFGNASGGTWQGSSDEGEWVERSLPQEEKNLIVKKLEQLSKSYPRILAVPGTIAWKKPFARSPAEQFHKPRKKARHGEQRKRGRRKTKSRRQKARRALEDYPTEFEGLTPPKLNPHVIRALNRGIQEGNIEHGEHEVAFKIVPWAAERNFPSQAVATVTPVEDKLEELDEARFLMRNTAYVLLGGKVRFKYNKRGDFHEAIGANDTVFIPGMKIGTQRIGGIDFGFEICLDHSSGYLKQDLERIQESGSTPKLPQIHIVTSAGVDTERDHQQVRPGGYFVHVSTLNGQTTVEGVGLGTKATKLHETTRVGGDTIEYWTIQL